MPNITLVPVWQFSGGKVYLGGIVSSLLYIPPITTSLIQPPTGQNCLSIVTFRIDNKLFCQNKKNLKIAGLDPEHSERGNHTQGLGECPLLSCLLKLLSKDR